MTTHLIMPLVHWFVVTVSATTVGAIYYGWIFNHLKPKPAFKPSR